MRSLALVTNKGKVFWPPPTKFRSTCQVDVAYFPFDDQTCMLKLGSWLHDGFSVSTYLNNINMFFKTIRRYQVVKKLVKYIQLQNPK